MMSHSFHQLKSEDTAASHEAGISPKIRHALTGVAANDDRPRSDITVEAISRHVMRPGRQRFVLQPFKPQPTAKIRQPGSPFWPAAICLVTAIALIAAIGERRPLVRNVPQTAAVFKAISMPVNLRGLDIKDVKARLFEENGQQVLAVEGIIKNALKTGNHVSPLLISLRGEDGREIYSWSAQPGVSRLDGGANLMFRTRLASPPSSAKTALVNFAEADNDK